MPALVPIIAGGVVIGGILFAWSLCIAAARGDEMSYEALMKRKDPTEE